MGLKIYRITYDGQDRIVEESTFGNAVAAWRRHMIAKWKADDEWEDDGQDDDIEPESVELICDDPVIRGTA